MARSSILLLLVLLMQVLGWVTFVQACFCDRYPWQPWSACSRTCNHGEQHRRRNLVKNDDYYWKNSCEQLCKSETRACNEHFCPINCVLTEYGEWSACSPCAKQQLRTRYVQRPAQFGGAACDPMLKEDRPCFPSTECKIPAVNCKDKFQCENGRCINMTLTCNTQNDCGDNSDERNCAQKTEFCATSTVVPGADLIGNGFDAIAEEPRGSVLGNMFMGGSCNTKRPTNYSAADLPTLIYYRIPYNFEHFEIKVGVTDHFSIDPRPVEAEVVDPVNVDKSSSGGDVAKKNKKGFLFVGFLFVGSESKESSRKYNDAFKASKNKASTFIRVNQILPVSKFKLRGEDLILDGPFLQFLNALPLDYNYPLYRDIFQRFGTHYYASGTMGGHYDLLYQYSREDLNTSGQTLKETAGCLAKDILVITIIINRRDHSNRCDNNKMTEKYNGSYIKSAEKSFSMVRGGGTREASELAWERKGALPSSEKYKDWVKTLIVNPALVEYEVRPLINLVRGIPCAATKRRHLRTALIQYLQEFDSCKCAPCPNNARAVLSGTECKCICQTGTFGDNCEKRSPDYTSETVDGFWSCWGPWSSCSAVLKRHRTRECNNPRPMKGGKPCQGLSRAEDRCHISLFEKQDTCDNDDDFTEGLRDELPPGVQGCLRPKRPGNSYLLKAKLYYDFGEHESFECFTGFELDGFQYVSCLPDGTWTPPTGQCIKKQCFAPENVPESMTLYPTKEVYRVGEAFGLNCKEPGLAPIPRGFYTCSERLTWEPPLPADLRCSDENPYIVQDQCDLGQTLEGGQCVCARRESCLSFKEAICVLNVEVNVTVPMSICSFHAGRCHGDPLFFVNEGKCDDTKLDWARFRAEMSSISSTNVPCGLDRCYEWETCSALERCECISTRDCHGGTDSMYCLKIRNRNKSMNLCKMATLKCSNYVFEVLNEGNCEAR